MTTTTLTTSPRMTNPVALLDGASGAIFALMKASRQTDLAHSTLELVHLRVSQINGCSPCVDSGVKSAKQAGETDERLHAVVAWRENGAVPRWVQWFASGSLAFSFGLLMALRVSWPVLTVVGAVFVAVSAYLLTRPNA